MGVSKHFVAVPWGEVHYRQAGSGPPVVLLHDSPRSSVLHLPLLEALSDRFTVIALDTPGYGESTPLPIEGEPRIAHFSEALGQTLTALGIARAAIYAFHTSSKILLDLAARQPERVGIAILDGLSIPTGEPDHAFIDAYMRPFEIDAEGAWLAREWTRTKDSLRWFPWFSRTRAARMPIAGAEIDYLQAYCLDYFMSGPNYARAYGAAMRHSPLENIARLKAPVVFMARADDVLFPFLDLLPDPLPAGCRIERLPADREVWRERVSAILAAGAGEAPHAPAARTEAPARRYLDLPHGQLLVHRFGPAEGRPIVYLHEPPGGAAADRPLLQALGERRPVYALDLPGCGQSDPLPAPTGAAYAEALASAVDALGLRRFDLIAEGLATPLALALAARLPARVAAAVLDGVILADADLRAELSARLCPPIVPEWSGAHLHRAWHLVRDREAQFPWYGAAIDTIRNRDPGIDAMRLYALTLDILKQPDRYGDAVTAALDHDAGADLAAATIPILAPAEAGDTRDRWAARAVEIGRAVTRLPRPADPAARARQQLDFLDRTP